MKILEKKKRACLNGFIILFLLLFQVYFITMGMLKYAILDHLPFSGTGLLNYASLWGILLALFMAVHFQKRVTFYQFVAVVFSLVVVLISGIDTFAVLALAALSFVCVGKKVTRIFFYQSGNDAINILVGAGSLGTVVGIMAHFPVNYRPVYLLILICPALICKQEVIEVCKRWYDLLSSHAEVTVTERMLEILVASIAMVYLITGLMPEVGHDALTLHLLLPMYVGEHHFWPFDISWHVCSVMPLLGDWLFTLVYLPANEMAAKLMVTAFVFISALIIFQFAMPRWGKKSACAAVLCFLSCPVVFCVAGSMFIEAFWLAFTLGALVLFLDGAKKQSAQNPLGVCGLLLGFATACKLMPLLMIPAMIIGALFNWRRCSVLMRPRYLILGTATFILGAGKPYLVAFIKTGNPVFPFFNTLFKSNLFPMVNTDNPLYHQGLNWDTLYLSLFESAKYLEAGPGAPGFTWLTLLPVTLYCLWLQKDRQIWFLFITAICFTALIFYHQSYLRYIMPFFALMSLCIVSGLKEAGRNASIARIPVLTVFIGTILLNLLFLFSGGWRYRDFPIQTLAGQSQRSDYVQAYAPQRLAVDFVNAMPDAGGTVAVVGNNGISGLKTDNILFASKYNERFCSRIIDIKTKSQLLEFLKDYHINTFIVSDVHVPDQVRNSPETQKEFSKLFTGLVRFRTLLLDVTESMVTYGSVSVRKMRQELLFQKDLLLNGSLKDVAGFYLFPGAEYLHPQRALRVSVKTPAYQSVNVSPGRRYRLKARIACDSKPADGRLQVNWLNAAGTFIKTDIRVVACDLNQTAHMDITAPKTAQKAVIYASGHTEEPVLFKQLWFLSEY